MKTTTKTTTKTSKHAAEQLPVEKQHAARTLARIFEQQAGKIASVYYIKADGSTGKHNCRLGVRRYVKGHEMTPAQAAARARTLTVYKMADARNKGTGAQNYRTLKPESITALACAGVTYTFK